MSRPNLSSWIVWFALVCSGIATGQDTVGLGSIRGTLSRHDGSPAAGVRVCIDGTKQCVISDDSGRFSGLDARPGGQRLQVFLESGETLLTSEVESHASLTSEVLLQLPEIATVQSSVTVSASVLLTPDEVVTSGIRVQSHEIAKAAGALQDVSRYVSTLPGVVTGSADFRNDIIVRGGSPLENLFIVDNIEIPNINNFGNFASAGGTVSLLDVQLIEDVTFLTGGYPAPYVNRLSSVMQVAQREGSRERFRARGTLAYAGAGGVLEGPWANGAGSWVVSARRSYLDTISDDLGFGGVPVFYSFTAKAVRDLGLQDRVWATSITGLDNIRLGLGKDLDTGTSLSALDIRYRGFRNATGVNWQRIFGSRGVGLLGLSHASARVASTVKDLTRGDAVDRAVGYDEIIAGGLVMFEEDSAEEETTLKYDLSWHAGSLGEYRVGGTQKYFVNNYLTLSPLGYEGAFSIVPDVNPIALRERVTGVQSSIYLQGTHALTGALRLTLGGRFDRYGHFGVSRSRISPRAGLTVALSKTIFWNTSWGVYHQMPFYLFLAAFPQNRLLNPARSEHWVSGLAWSPGANVRITIEGYSKLYKDYPVSSQFPELSFANVGDTFDVRDILYPMTSAGRGRARGIEFFAEKKFAGSWFGQVNFAYSRTRHAGLDRNFRPGAFDRPYVFNAVGGRRVSAKWELATRTSWMSGRPFTPFRDELSRAQRRGIFDLGRVNALRSRAFFTLDIRVDRTFRLQDQIVIVYGGLLNVTGRENFTGVNWSRRTNRDMVDTGQGRFPLVGLEWSF